MRDFEHFGTAEGLAAGARALLIECGFHGDMSSRAVAQDHCLRFLELSGVLPAETLAGRLPGWRLPDGGPQQVLEVTGAEVAQTASVRFVHRLPGAGADRQRRHRDRPRRIARDSDASRRLRADPAFDPARAARCDGGALRPSANALSRSANRTHAARESNDRRDARGAHRPERSMDKRRSPSARPLALAACSQHGRIGNPCFFWQTVPRHSHQGSAGTLGFRAAAHRPRTTAPAARTPAPAPRAVSRS